MHVNISKNFYRGKSGGSDIWGAKPAGPVDSQLIGANEQANIYNSYICTKITANFEVGIFDRSGRGTKEFY